MKGWHAQSGGALEESREQSKMMEKRLK